MSWCLQKTLFWAQVHEIPMHFMSKKAVESLCETVCEVQKLIGEIDDEGGYFIRIRVLINITLSLCRERVITMENGDKNWVSFKYEQLLNLCFWCRRLTHNDKNCNLWIKRKGTLSLDQQQFNSS